VARLPSQVPSADVVALSEVGEDFVARGPLGSREKGQSTRSHFSRRKPSNWPVGGLFRGCLPLSNGEHYSVPIIIAVAEPVPVWMLPPRLMGEYERICKGILQAHKAEQAELIQKRQRRGSILDQSGLLSWPIFCFCQGGGRDHRPALHIICAHGGAGQDCTGAGDDQMFHGSCDLARGSFIRDPQTELNGRRAGRELHSLAGRLAGSLAGRAARPKDC
jgi:hypothetical protein